MSEVEVRVVLERPRDRLLTERIHMLGGWFEVAGGAAKFSLRAECAGREIPLHECLHPARRERGALRGFFGYLFLQDLISGLDNGWLDLNFLWKDVPVKRVSLRVSPAAVELSTTRPLNRRFYSVENRRQTVSGMLRDAALVFPGLGGVGGSSLNMLMRQLLPRLGYSFPVLGEANDPRLWTWMAPQMERCRWIDGHSCYQSGSLLNGPSARVTLLRDPGRRLVSVFNYNSLVHPFEFPFATFEEFLHSDSVKLYTQAYGLLKLAGDPPSAAETDEDLYSAAKSELDRNYAFVGITELFEETVFLICDQAGYSEVGMWWRVLSAPRFERLERLSSSGRKQLKRVTAVDDRLYQSSLCNLRKLLSVSDFGEELNRYRRDALSQLELSDGDKLAECLRWRQLITEEELLALRAQSRREGNRQ